MRWVLAAAHPDCWPESVVAGFGVYGGPILMCGERGFRYEETTDLWQDERPGWREPWWFEEDVAACEPGDQTLAAARYDEPPLFVLTRSYWSIAFDAALCDPWREPHHIDTLDPPIDDISALLTIGRGILAAGPTQSAIYERRPIP